MTHLRLPKSTAGNYIWKFLPLLPEPSLSPYVALDVGHRTALLSAWTLGL